MESWRRKGENGEVRSQEEAAGEQGKRVSLRQGGKVWEGRTKIMLQRPRRSFTAGVHHWGKFASQRTLDNVSRHFWFSQLGMGVLLHLVGSGQGCS